jgi:hypothetical protein
MAGMSGANRKVRHKGNYRYSIGASLDEVTHSLDGNIGEMSPRPYRLTKDGRFLRFDPDTVFLRTAVLAFVVFGLLVAVLAGYLTGSPFAPMVCLVGVVLLAALLTSMARQIDHDGPLIVCDSETRRCSLPAHGLSFTHDQLIAWQVISGLHRSGLNIRSISELNLLAVNGKEFLCCHVLAGGAKELSGIATELAEATGISTRIDKVAK